MFSRSPWFVACSCLLLAPQVEDRAPAPTSPDWLVEGSQSSSSFGHSLAGGGDVNGDGCDDLLVGANAFDAEAVDTGLALLYLGAEEGPAPEPAWKRSGGQFDSHFGGGVAIAGDVNGDGFDDVLVGASRFRSAAGGRGQIHLYLGSAAGLSDAPDWSAEAGVKEAHFGGSAARAGDVNGDGFDDVLVGASGTDLELANEGRARLWLGSAEGLGPEAAWTAEGATPGAGFGGALAGVGDVNGDGFEDVLIGAPGFPGRERREGCAYLFLGSPDGLAPSAAWRVEGTRVGAALGRRVAAAGDVDGDGFADVLVSAPGFDLGFEGAGEVFLFRGSADGLESEPAWKVTATAPGNAFGYSVAGVGDLDGDGHDDVAIGAPRSGGGALEKGTVMIYSGSPSGLGANASRTIDLGRPYRHFGACLVKAGDVNGDGLDDLLVGTPSYDGALTDAGAALLFFGAR